MIKNKESLKGIIRNLASKNNVDSHYLLQSYMFEALLKRISKSKYKENFIIKGGLLLSSIFGIDLRSTMDLDTTILGIAINQDTMEKIIKEIISIDVNDAIKFRFIRIDNIRKEDIYSGYSVRLEASYDDLYVDLTIDITVGDVITYQAIEYKYKTIFDDNIDILSYNFETIIAEKFESIISRNVNNTRMKDYYDLYMFVKYKWNDVNISILKQAIENTSKHRNTEKIIKKSNEYINLIKQNNELKKLWSNYQKNYSYASNIDFEEVIRAIVFINNLL